MKITVCSHADFANYGYLNAKAMRSVGLDAQSFVLKPHPFNYPESSPVVSIDRIRKECEDSDIVVVMHSCGTMFDVVKDLPKPVFVFHTGTRYRVNKAKYDELWSRRETNVVVALGEFYREGVQFMGITVDDGYIRPDYTTNNKTVFGHYPSNHVVKGTDAIRRAFMQAKQRIDISTVRLPWKDSIRRMRRCDVYVELFAPLNKGFEYGSFGTTAVEAAAMGKVVITQNLHEKVYYQHHLPSPGIVFVRTMDDLVQAIREAAVMGRKEMIEYKQAAREWVENNHGLVASGNRMIKILGL